jgi:hypothetical protein
MRLKKEAEEREAGLRARLEAVEREKKEAEEKIERERLAKLAAEEAQKKEVEERKKREDAERQAREAADARNDKFFRDALLRAEKIMQQGRNVIRLVSGGKRAVFVSLFIRMMGDSKVYSLFWCKANDRTPDESRAMRFDDIHTIVVGKQASAHLAPSALQHAVPDECCLSIISSRRTLHIQAGNERDRDTWVFGLAALIKHTCDVKPRVMLRGQYRDNDSVKTKEAQEESQETDDGAKEVKQSDVDSLKHTEGQLFRLELAVKCQRLPSKYQNHIICLVDKDEKTDKVRLHT